MKNTSELLAEIARFNKEVASLKYDLNLYKAEAKRLAEVVEQEVNRNNYYDEHGGPF